jgi:hypothetical protein
VPKLLALLLVALTFPVWGGAILAVMAGGLTLALTHPWALLAIFAAPFIFLAMAKGR